MIIQPYGHNMLDFLIYYVSLFLYPSYFSTSGVTLAFRSIWDLEKQQNRKWDFLM